MKKGLVAVQRYYKGSTIAGYLIQDISNGEVRQFSSEELKNLIASKKLNVANLTLTADGKLRLVTNDETINNRLDLDGSSDNNEVFDGVYYDDIMKGLIDNLDACYKVIKVVKFDGDRNTFIIGFRTGRVLDKFVYVIIKYKIYTEYGKIHISMVPLALNVKNKTYKIHIVTNEAKKDIQFSSRDLLACGELDIESAAAVKFREKISLILYRTFIDIITNDKQAMHVLERYADKAHNLRAEDDRINNRKGFAISSALTHGAMFALMLTCHEPGLAAGISATSGILLNCLVQYIRLQFTDYYDYAD